MSKLMFFILNKFPQIKQTIIQAHLKETPEAFVKRTLIMSFYLSATFTILLFFLFDSVKIPLLPLLFLFPISYLFSFSLLIQSPRVVIRRREREMNKEVLFAGRYLLIKLDSGVPLFNALTDASKSYGVSAKFFKEIVDDIHLGDSIEDALDKARESSPSRYFKLILSEIITSLKTGVDVSTPLRSVLAQITKEQMLEIKEYGKKLNAFMLLYMVLGTVMPSLGITIFIVIAGFMSLPINNTFMMVALGMLAFINFIFISVLKAMRPMVNL